MADNILKYFIGVFLFSLFIPFAYADTLYLKNGRSIEGIVTSEDEKTVELEVGSGSVKFLKKEIVNIVKASSQESDSLRRQWDEQKIALQNKIAKQKLEEESLPRAIAFTPNLQGIVLDVLLNDKVQAKMVLDTGAATMLITRDIADKLSINLNNVQPDMKVFVADGRTVNAKHIVIDKVKVEGAESNNVECAILFDKMDNLSFGDGLLGMSFLKYYNFKVDQKEKKLTLEKLR